MGPKVEAEVLRGTQKPSEMEIMTEFVASLMPVSSVARTFCDIPVCTSEDSDFRRQLPRNSILVRGHVENSGHA